VIAGKRTWVYLLIAVFPVAWLGIPAFNKWRADNEVDELCAKDGGVIVHETVTLPKERFNKLGELHVLDKSVAKPHDEFFSTRLVTNIRGNSNLTTLDALVTYRAETTYYRTIDQKMLGRVVTYSRRGGDPIGPWHPSQYKCPNDSNLLRRIFVPLEK
jgi:hypothetical protein